MRVGEGGGRREGKGFEAEEGFEARREEAAVERSPRPHRDRDRDKKQDRCSWR